MCLDRIIQARPPAHIGDDPDAILKNGVTGYAIGQPLTNKAGTTYIKPLFVHSHTSAHDAYATSIEPVFRIGHLTKAHNIMHKLPAIHIDQSETSTHYYHAGFHYCKHPKALWMYSGERLPITAVAMECTFYDTFATGLQRTETVDVAQYRRINTLYEPSEFYDRFINPHKE